MTAPVPLPDLFTPDDWVALLDVSLTGIHLVRPVYGPADSVIVDFALEYLNPAGQRMTGLGEQPGGTLLDRFPHALAEDIFQYYRRVFETGEQLSYETNYQADGLDNFFQCSARRSGAHLLVSFTDTRDQNRSAVEEALRTSQAAEQAARAEAEQERQRFYAMLMQAPATIVALEGPELRITLANPLYRQLVGDRPLLGQPLREAVPELVQQPHLLAALAQVYQTGQPLQVQEVKTQSDRTNTGRLETTYFNTSHYPTHDAQGRVTGILSFSYDVTEQVLARRQVEQFNQELEARVQARTQELAQAQAEVESQRQRLHQLVAEAPAMIASLRGPDYVVELANEGFRAVFGGRDLLGIPYREAIPEFADQPFFDLLDTVYRTGETYYALDQLVHVDRHNSGQLEELFSTFIYQATRDAQGQIDGLLLFGYEVTEQVRARQRVEQLNQELETRVAERTAQLRWQESQLQQILGQVPAAIATFTGPAHRFAFFNEAYRTLARRPPRLDQPLSDVFPEAVAQGFVSLLDEVYATGRPFRSTEAPLDLEDPTTGETTRRYLDYLYQPLPDEPGRPGGILSFAVDVTEKVLARRQNEALQTELLAAAQQRAQERETFYQVFEQTPAAICLQRGPEHRYEYVNPAYQALFPAHRLVGRPVEEAVPGTAEQGFVDLLDHVYRTGETFRGTEVPVVLRDAAGTPVQTSYFTFTYHAFREDGQIAGIATFAYDVSEQVRARQRNEALQTQLLAVAQQQAQAREALYQVFEQTAVVVALLRGPSHRFEYVNPPYQAFNPGRQLVGLDVAVATPEVVAPGFVALLDQVYQTGETFYGREVPFTPPPAPGQPPRPAYFNFTYQAYREAGEIVGISIFATDVTEQVLARQAQETQRRELEQLFMQAPVPIVILDGPALVFQLINPAYQGIFPGRALAGKPLLQALPELVGTTIPDLFAQVYHTGEPVTVQELPLLMARHEGAAPEEIYWSFTYQARRAADGAIDGVRVFAYDVTEQVGARKLLHRLNQEAATLNTQLRDFNAVLAQQVAERTQTLQESRDLLQSIFDTSFTALLVLKAERDAEGALQDFRVELSNEEAARQTGRPDLVGQPYPQLFPGLFELMRRALETGEPQQQEFFYSADGSPHWYSVLFVKLADGVVVHSLDITARQLAEQERRRHLVLLEQAETVAGLGSWDYDRTTGELRWSTGLHRLFGLASGEEFRQPAHYFDYVAPKDRPVVEHLLAYLRAGQGPFEETLRLQVGEQVKTVRLQAVVLPAVAGEPERVLGVHLDISEVQRLAADSLRLGQQQALFEAVLEAQETERQRIAEGLHNGVGQLLFATKLRLDQLQDSRLNAEPALAEARRDAARLLADAIHQTRVLSHELVPLALAEFGLAAALQDVCRQLSTPQLPLHCHVLFDELAPPLPALLQLALYRMAQELGLNIVKHARGATEASLELETTPGFVLLRAEDNGGGFTPNAAASPGMGLRTIRDRVTLLQGEFEQGHHAGFGTFVRLRIPLPALSPS